VSGSPRTYGLCSEYAVEGWAESFSRLIEDEPAPLPSTTPPDAEPSDDCDDRARLLLLILALRSDARAQGRIRESG
jgi:hypothetical protein